MINKSDVLLEIKNLSVAFRQDKEEFEAVKQINLQVLRGKTLGIVGESGSGKSVTALAVMGLLAPMVSVVKQGEIILYPTSDRPISLLNLPEKDWQHYRGSRISMVFQEPMTSLNPVMRCGKQVEEVILLHRRQTRIEAQQQVLKLFEEVRIRDPKAVYKAYPHEISGGQKQRVMIAMAMACRPDLLIADEPTTALDVTVQKTILGLFRDLQQNYGMGMIFISHDLAIVKEVSDHIAVMKQGEVVESGAREEIFSNPQHPYTQGLLACRPPMDKRLSKLPTVDDFLNQKPDGDNSERKALVRVISPQERKTHLDAIYRQEAVLVIKDLSVRFPSKFSLLGRVIGWNRVVNHIDLDVYQGETLGLVGESGCGKTTLGRGILRLVEASSGQILYKGTDIRKLSSKELQGFRKNLQIIFQDPYSSLNPKITVGESIVEPMKVHGILNTYHDRKEKAMMLLTRVGLEEHHFKRYPHQFSGGQRQRVCIARAIALQPEFIICDESVSALDISLQAQVLNLLNELKQDFGFTYIFISHDLSVVRFMADRIVVMEKGIIVEQAEADQLFKSPKADYTKKLIESIPSV